MRHPRLPRALEDALLGLVVGALALATVRLPEVEDRRGERGPWGPGGFRGGAGGDSGAGGTAGRRGHLLWTVDGAELAAVLVLVAALALRRTAPRVAFLGVVAATAGYLLAGGPYALVLLGPALALHTLVTRLPPRQWLLLLLGVPLSLSAGFWTRPYGGLTDPGLYLAMVLGTAAVLLPGLVTLVRSARREAERQDLLAARRRSSYEERLQIAREVHDVVGHSLAVINMQAGVALHLLERRPDQLGPSLEAIRSTSKTALAELGSTLATLRGDALVDQRGGTGEEREVEPPAGLGGLDHLVAALQAAGRTVHYDRPPADQLQLPVPVQHVALRIAQEGLTNVVRHAAPDARITLTLRREGRRLVVEVQDDGRTAHAPYREGSGIAGMRERAAAVGGQVLVGPRSGSGFGVRVELPVDLGPARPATGRSADVGTAP